VSAPDHLGRQFDTYYHRTSPEAAGKIISSGKLKRSRTEDHVFVSTHHDRDTTDFGRSVVEVQIPAGASKTQMARMGNETWYGVRSSDVKPVRAWSDRESK